MEGASTRRVERSRAGGDEITVARLVQRLSQQTSTLIRQEMRLATVELQEKGRHAGKGAGMFGGAGLVALYGVGALVAAAILGLATALEPWIAALIVAVALLAIAGILALSGKRQVNRATPLMPERALESAQHDVVVVKERVRR